MAYKVYGLDKGQAWDVYRKVINHYRARAPERISEIKINGPVISVPNTKMVGDLEYILAKLKSKPKYKIREK